MRFGSWSGTSRQLTFAIAVAGSTVLAVHHDLNTLTSYFDWLALLNVRLVASGPVEEAFTTAPTEGYGAMLRRRVRLIVVILVVGGFLALTFLEGGDNETADRCEAAQAI